MRLEVALLLLAGYTPKHVAKTLGVTIRMAYFYNTQLSKAKYELHRLDTNCYCAKCRIFNRSKVKE